MNCMPSSANASITFFSVGRFRAFALKAEVDKGGLR
jgi:hypothetical protein